MSLDNAKKFIERMKTDEDFRDKVTACKDAEERMSFIKSSGYDCTREDIELVKGELSDGDLERISGGAGPCQTTQNGVYLG